MTVGFFITVLFFIAIGIAEFFVFIKSRKINAALAKREEESKRKMYEMEILRELGDKIGYSLGAQNVIEIIIKSLRDIVEYNVVSYMLLSQEKLVFRAYAEKPASKKFIADVKTRMVDYISTTLKTDFKNIPVEETSWGSVFDGELDDKVGSFFCIPLTISGKVVGFISVADKRANLYKEKEINIVNGIVQQATQAVTKLQEVVESENSKLNAMVASMTDGIVMTDMDERVLVVNPAAKKALGLETKIEISVLDIAKGLKEKLDIKDKIDESVRLEKVFVSEEISLGNGFFQIIISPVRDRWKNLGCVVVLRDMTHEKEVEQIKEDFTAMIVHELRSPLDSIKKMAELMRQANVKKANRESCLQMIYSNSSDMLELINNLLNIAKIEAGKFEVMKQKSSIKKIIESRVLFFNIAAKDVKVNLTSQFADNIPETVEFDPRTISEVLNNLISNALKFTKENGAVTVQTLLHKNGESLEKEAKVAGINWFIKADISNIPDSLFVAVTDNGAGIAPDQINRLFNKFIQAKSTFVEKSGTGLGLAIVKSIVESHGGTVGAESIEGKGSTFYFTLPI
ncbi:MAG: ATP-binding protein [Candidatus Staskawiczbacteria bacterium]|nr:ATP-binding protein [Candidatus Staskawiczbacteria bacterium]